MAEQQQNTMALAVITGTLPEKIQAFQQIAQTAVAGMFGSWDTPQKALAGAWCADAIGVHPAIYYRGVTCIPIGGKFVQEPSWKFIHALLKSRLRGFKFRVIHKGTDYCELHFADGDGNEHTEKYTIADATRQGLTTKNKSLYSENVVEGLFKQAYKRGADVIGAHVLAGLPEYGEIISDDDPVAPAEPARVTTSGAEVVVEPVPNAHDALVAKVNALWPNTKGRGAKARAAFIEKMRLVWHEALGADLPETVDADEVRRALAWLTAKYPNGAAVAAPAPVEPEVEAEPSAGVAAADEDTPEADAPAQAAPAPAPGLTWETFVRTVEHARKVTKRPILKAGVKDQTKMYLTDAQVLGLLLETKPILVWHAGAVLVEPARLAAIEKAIVQVADTAAMPNYARS